MMAPRTTLKRPVGRTMNRIFLFLCLLTAPCAFTQTKQEPAASETNKAEELNISPAKPEVAEGTTTSVVVKLGKTAMSWDDYDAALKDTSTGKAAARIDVDKGGVLHFQAPINIPQNWNSAIYTVTFKKKSYENSKSGAKQKSDAEQESDAGKNQESGQKPESKQKPDANQKPDVANKPDVKQKQDTNEKPDSLQKSDANTKKPDANQKELEVSFTVVHETKVDWEARAIIGWHQAGASSADSSQHLFFDFFVARPFGSGAVYNSKVNLWGQVRVASAPQQRSIPLSQFAVDFVGQLGAVNVNELAQSAEFLTGFEMRPFCQSQLNRTPEDKARWYDICRSGPDHVRTLSFVGFFGANGAFSDPTTVVRIFRVPDSSSPQRANFIKQFPSFSDPAFSEKAKYLGLVPPDRERFFRQYGVGIRYTSYDRKKPGNAPAMYTATIGQDQSITGGRYVGTVLKFDAFYPLPFHMPGGPSFIYLFGTANLAVAKPKLGTPLGLELVSSPCQDGAPAGDSGTKCNVKLYQNDVAVFTFPSARDTYRIGIGIDFIGFLKSLPTSKQSK